jgi:hypothetical protein
MTARFGPKGASPGAAAAEHVEQVAGKASASWWPPALAFVPGFVARGAHGENATDGYFAALLLDPAAFFSVIASGTR